MNGPADQSARDLARDVQRSLIVRAPAGSGKTTLLVERYLRLLACVQEPEEILAITFTVKAAAEMRLRVLDALRKGTATAQAALARDRREGWDLLRQPARLKIQTIDSFAMTLARQLPIRSGFNPEARLTEAAAPYYEEAAERVLLRLYRDDPFRREIAGFLAGCGNDGNRARRLLADMLAHRDQWIAVAREVMVASRSGAAAVSQSLAQGRLALTGELTDAFLSALTSAEREALEAAIDVAAENREQPVTTRAERYRLAGELLTRQDGALRKQLTIREGLPPEAKATKAELLDLIGTLDRRELGSAAANLRFLPQAMSPAAEAALTEVCLCLVLAALELKTCFEEAQVSDFTELLITAQAALGEALSPSELALALDHRLSHVLVDEFQDTSVSQFRLFEQLLAGFTVGDGSSFFAVGDPMQSIYRFRDADVGLFYRAAERGVAELPLESVSLSSNFRSAPAIVDWCNSTFQRILGGQQDPALGAVPFSASAAERDDAGEVRWQLYADTQAQAEGVAETLVELLAADDDASIALLVRSRGQLAPLLPELKRRGISWQANDIDPLLDKPAVRDLINLARLLEDPEDALARFATLRAPFCGLKLTDLEPLAEAAEAPAEGPGAEAPAHRLSADGQRRLERLEAAFRKARARLDELPPRTVLETLWLELGGADAYDDPSTLNHAERLLILLDAQGPVLDSSALEEAALTLFASDVEAARLSIMTIHKAKGLEFDVVLLPFLDRTTRADEAELLLWRALPEGLLLGTRDDDGSYAWLRREDQARDAHERERLLYVACTRARRKLLLFATPGERPAPRSLLALLWPDIEAAVADGTLPVASADRVPEQAPLFPTAEGRDLVRHPEGYEWTPADEVAALTVGMSPSPAVTDVIERDSRVALGIILHRELERLAQASGASPDDPAGRRGSWQRQARQLGVPDEAIAGLLRDLESQLERVLDDPDGRWLLSAADDASAELRLTVASGHGTEHLVLDRTFRFEGRRWVVDYKTGAPHADTTEEEFVAAEISRYRPQLDRYAEAAAALFEEPVVKAIYFTALPRLEVLS